MSDLFSGAELRDDGMQRVEANASLNSKRAAKWAIVEVARQAHPTTQWTTDAVHQKLEAWGVELHDNRLLGPLMRSAESAGFIERVVCPTCERQETTFSDRPERHRGPQYLWRSRPENIPN